MANPAPFWKNFKANPVIKFLSIPFKWIGRHLKSVWERFGSHSKKSKDNENTELSNQVAKPDSHYIVSSTPKLIKSFLSPELRALKQAKRKEYDQMRLSDVHNSYKTAMQNPAMALMLSPQGEIFLNEISDIKEKSRSDSEIMKDLNNLASLQCTPKPAIPAEQNISSDDNTINSYIQAAYKAIQRARSLVERDDLLLTEYDHIMQRAYFLEGHIVWYKRERLPSAGESWKNYADPEFNRAITRLNHKIDKALSADKGAVLVPPLVANKSIPSQLAASTDESYQKKAIAELVAFCVEHKINGANEINNSDKTSNEKILALKELTADAIMSRFEMLHKKYKEAQVFKGHFSFVLEKIHPFVMNAGPSNIWNNRKALDDASQAPFVKHLKEADAVINEWAVRLGEDPATMTDSAYAEFNNKLAIRIEPLLAFCSERNQADKANELKNSLKHSPYEKIILLKELSHKIVSDKINALDKHMLGSEAYQTYCGLREDKKIDLLLSTLLGNAKSATPPDYFIEQLKKIEDIIAGLASDLRFQVEPVVVKPVAPTIPAKPAAPAPIISSLANLAAKEKVESLDPSKELERLLKVKTEEYDKMKVSDVPSSYKTAMKDPSMALARSPQGSFMAEMTREAFDFDDSDSDDESEKASKSIQQKIDLLNKTQLVSLEFKPKAVLKSYRDDVNPCIQNAYKAIDEARSLIHKDNLSLKEYDIIINSAQYLEGVIDFTCNNEKYQKANTPKNIRHDVVWQKKQEQGVAANIAKVNELIKAAKLSSPGRKSSLKG